MIRYWLADLISNYSWINRVERRGLYYFFFYNTNGQERYSRLSYRAKKHQIKNFLQKIEKEADKIERKKIIIGRA